MDVLVDYVPMDRRHALVQGSVLPERTTGAVLFADLAGFTPVTETIARAFGPYRGAEELLALLNRIYAALMAECDLFGGSVVGFGGDAITVWFDCDASASLVEAGRRAAACAQAMQAAMGPFHALSVPGGQALTLALKTTVTVGPVSRLLVGDPDVQLLEVLAGATMRRLAEAAHLTQPGEVALDGDTGRLLDKHLRVAGHRAWGAAEDEIVIVGELTPVEPRTWPELAEGALSADQARPWLLPPVYARLRSGQGEFLAELRNTVSLFMEFADLDYDYDVEAKQRLDTFIRRVQRILARYEGWLLQVSIGDKGNYLYASFGAPVAHGDDAARAVGAALELRALTAELPFLGGLRIGISGGEARAGSVGATTRFYSINGDSVNLAARLMQAAEPGQVLLSANLAPSISRRYDLVSLPPRQVKGKSEPVPIMEIGETQAASSVQLQEPQYALPLVGRAAECAVIEEKIALARRDQGQIVGITGEAGMGKSRLVAEAIRRSNTSGFIGFGGAAQSTGTQTAYLAWRPIWRAFFQLEAKASMVEQAASLEKTLAALDPEMLPRLPLLGIVLGLPLPENDLTRTLDAKLRKELLEGLLVDCLKARFKPHPVPGAAASSTAAASRPLLLVLEDTHWLDALSFDLLKAVGRSVAGLPVLLVMAYRPPEAGQSSPFPFAGQAHSTEIRLGELTPDESAQLIEYKAALVSGEHAKLPRPFVEAIIARTERNPFYIEELLNYLHERGVTPGDMTAFQQLELPGSLASLILSRIDQLTVSQQTTLKVASIIGRIFRMSWLWGVYPGLGPQEHVREDLDLLARLDITPLEAPEPDLSYLFKHATTQQVTYESIPFAMRAQLHEQLAAWLESRSDGESSFDLLAFHYGRSANRDKQREYFRKAGDSASARYANMAAIDYYEHLVDLLSTTDKVPILVAMGRIFTSISSWDAAEARLREALTLAAGAEEAHWHAQAQLGLGNSLRERARYEDALVELEEARREFEALDDRAGLSETLLQEGRTYWYQQKLDRTQALVERTLAMEGEKGDKPRTALALHVLGMVALAKMDLAGAREWWLKSLAIKREIGDKPGVASSLANLAMVAFLTGQLDEAQSMATESTESYRELHAGWEYGLSQVLLGLVLASRGEVARAREIQTENLALFRDLGVSPTLDVGLIGLAHATLFAEPTAKGSQDALKLLAAGVRIDETLKIKRMPFFQVIADGVRKRAQAQLDQTSADQAWAEGYAMSWQEAVAFGLARGQGAG